MHKYCRTDIFNQLINKCIFVYDIPHNLPAICKKKKKSNTLYSSYYKINENIESSACHYIVSKTFGLKKVEMTLKSVVLKKDLGILFQRII